MSFGVAVVTVSLRNRKASAKMAPRGARAPRPQRRRGELYRPFGVAELHAHVVLRPLHAAEPVDKVHVPRGAAELPVRRGLEAHLLLHPHDLTDRPILRGPQVVRRDASGGKVLAGPQKLGGTQQAPDVVGAERRCRAGHGASFGEVSGYRR